MRKSFETTLPKNFHSKHTFEIEIILNQKSQKDLMRIQFQERVTHHRQFSFEVTKKFEVIHSQEQIKMNFEIN